MAIATVLFPTLARFANSGEFDNLRATLANGMRQILFVLVPATAAILALSDPIIRLVYQRGEFSRAGHRRWSRRRSSGSPSRCRPTASTCCRPAPSSASSGPGWRPALAVIDLVVSARRGGRSSTSPSGRRHRRRRPGSGPSPRSSPRPYVLRRELGGLELGRLLADRDPDLARLRGPRRGRLRGLGRARRARSAAASPPRSSRSAPVSPLGGVVYLAAARLLRIAELEQILRLVRRRR